MPWNDCSAILLRAAEVVSSKYRYKLVTATMFGQGKKVKIDATAEMRKIELSLRQLIDGSLYRVLEGFVLAVLPSNFTAIGDNLPGETCTGFHIFQLLGLPDSRRGWRPIQFIPGLPPEVVAPAISHPSFTALHFTGSTFVFQKLWKDIAAYLAKYRGYLRTRQEGKNFHVIHKSTEIRNTVFALHSGQLRGPRQKCYALSRLYVSSSVWSPGFKDLLLSEVAKIKVGSPSDFSNFMGLMIGRPAYDKIKCFVQKAKVAGGEVLIGDIGDNSKGYFIQPTIILTKDPESITMKEDIFGPIITVYVYDDADYENSLELIDNASPYGLTGSIFAADRKALLTATKNKLRNTAGNIYYHEKYPGAVMGQQPYGGAQESGTNNEAGSISIFYRFVSARGMNENFVGLEDFQYPSNLI
ncbi:Aldehyde/histidinol dehydrogenase [Suillus lakei]|nr:Aldehyde/histidinol dehydrogenase [Suillus lakei]